MTTALTMKRKLEELEVGGPELGFTCQRQTILNISMCKLKQSPMRKVEPSLRRSVLIFNTLKHIEEQLKQEGVRLSSPASTKLLPNLGEGPVSDMTLDPPPSAENGPVVSHCVPMEVDCNMSGAQVCAASTVAHGVAPLTGHQNRNSVVATYERPKAKSASQDMSVPSVSGQLTVSSNGTSLLDISSSVTTHSASPVPLVNLPQSQTGSVVTATAATLPAAAPNVSDALADIDASLLDFDFIKSSWTPGQKLSPLSTDDLKQCFPSSVPFTESYNLPCYKNDLLSEDLDNIMQILVSM